MIVSSDHLPIVVAADFGLLHSMRQDEFAVVEWKGSPMSVSAVPARYSIFAESRVKWANKYFLGTAMEFQRLPELPDLPRPESGLIVIGNAGEFCVLVDCLSTVLRASFPLMSTSDFADGQAARYKINQLLEPFGGSCFAASAARGRQLTACLEDAFILDIPPRTGSSFVPALDAADRLLAPRITDKIVADIHAVVLGLKQDVRSNSDFLASIGYTAASPALQPFASTLYGEIRRAI